MSNRAPSLDTLEQGKVAEQPAYLPAHILRVMPKDTVGGYTPDQRYQTVLEWVVRGTIAEAAKIMGIPGPTVWHWTQQPWWDITVDSIQRQRHHMLDARLSAVVSKSLEETLDRLENGDVVVSQGVTRRVPVRARDAMFITCLAVDKQRLLRGHATRRTEVVNLNALRADLGQFVDAECQSIDGMGEDKEQKSEVSES